MASDGLGLSRTRPVLAEGYRQLGMALGQIA